MRRELDLAVDSAEHGSGNVQSSELIIRILTENVDLQMPPPDSRTKLTQRQREILRKWIEQGAEYEQHWAFVPLAAEESTQVD